MASIFTFFPVLSKIKDGTNLNFGAIAPMPLVSQQELISHAQSGQLVSFPTDTVPALAAVPRQAQLIFNAKQRVPDKPLILMGATVADLWPYVQGTPAELSLWEQIASEYWPGALTLVLPASDRVPPEMNPADHSTIGIRIPNSPLARTLLAETGPLATTSANLSGHPPIEDLASIALEFPSVFVLHPSEQPVQISHSGIPSTVAKWSGGGWQILRQGAVKL